MAKLAAARDLRKYDPDEPRVPAGNPDGGQWTSEGGDGGAADDDPVRLPPGKRIDELGDLLEWIANAKPEDTSAIRSEIKRLYYDVGDIQGGDALNRALSDALEATTTREREDILEDYEPYTRSDPADAAAFGRDLTTGVLLAPLLGPAAAPAATVPVDVWELGWAARGRQIEAELGANLPANFPVIDSFADGVATSIKSIDLNAAVYQDAGRLSARISTYVNQLAAFDGDALAGWDIEPEDIQFRTLKIAVPQGNDNAMQQAVIETTRLRAKKLGINLVITPF